MAFLMCGSERSLVSTLPAWIRPQRTLRDMDAPPREGKYSRGDGGGLSFCGCRLGRDRIAGSSVARLDQRIDDFAALLVRQESALHRVDCNFFKVIERQAEGIGCSFEFLGHGGIAHQAIIGVESNAKFLLIENPERMFGQAGSGSGMDVADQAHLQRNSLVENVLREVTQFHCSPVRNSDVFNQARPVPDAMRSTILNGLPNRFLAIALAGMNRDIEIHSLNVVKSVHMLLRRVAAFFAG